MAGAGLGLVAADFEAWWDFILGKFHHDSSSRAASDTSGFPNRNADGFEARRVQLNKPPTMPLTEGQAGRIVAPVTPAFAVCRLASSPAPLTRHAPYHGDKLSRLALLSRIGVYHCSCGARSLAERNRLAPILQKYFY